MEEGMFYAKVLDVYVIHIKLISMLINVCFHSNITKMFDFSSQIFIFSFNVWPLDL